MSCGVPEDEIKEQIALKEQIKQLNLNSCKRCEGEPYVLLQKRDVFCRLCFKEYCEHKFRSTIGKTKMIKPNHKVLIAYSGGQNSAAMIDLTLKSLRNESVAHRLLMKPHLLYIDETIILNNESKSDQYNSKIDEILVNFQMDKFYSRLEMYFREDDANCYAKNRVDNLLDDKDAQDKFHNVLKSFKSLTAKEEFLRRIRANLIGRIAKAEGIDFVFLGSNGTRLSIQLLTDVAQGKGNQVDSEICFVDSRDAKLKFLKPMREFISKEVVFWNKLNGNEFVEIEDLMTMKSAKSSIGKITEQFINYLQKDYPATTYTISKIGYKLQNQNQMKKRCLFCRSPVDENVANNLSAQMALIITNSFKSSSKPTFNSNYCYGCNVLLRESDDPENFIENVTRSDNDFSIQKD